MSHWKALGLGLMAVTGLGLSMTQAQNNRTVIGVSWSNFQEERWHTDEAAIRDRLAEDNALYVSTDAQTSSEKQLNDIDSLIASGAKALIVLAVDKDAIAPAIAKAKAAGIPVLGYDRLIEDSSAFYLTFDNVEVGRTMAREILKVKSSGNFAFIRGDLGDPNATFVYNGQREVLDPFIKAGRIKIVGEQATDGWKPDVAQRNMEQILTKNANKVDAVMSSNDGMAGGAVAALATAGLAGKVAVSGQDGDLGALNRIALGTQTVSVWKDARVLGKRAAEIALLLAKGTKFEQIPGRLIFSKGPKKIRMNSVFLKPIAITKANLNVVVDAKWITKDVLCKGVKAQTAPAACK